MEATEGKRPGDAENPLAHLIIGGGGSGVCLAACLAAQGVPRVDVLDPSASLGRGIAYAASDAQHLLNVTPDRMDANPVEGFPGFCDWLRAETGACDTRVYYPRRLFGEYMESVAEAVRKRTNLVHHRNEAVALHETENGYDVTCADGTVLSAKNVVIAVGNLAPRLIAPDVGDPRIVEDPWHVDFSTLSGLKKVIIAGSGLTAIDVVVSLLDVAPDVHVELCALRPFMPPADMPVAPWAGAAEVPSAAPSATWHWCLQKLRESPEPAHWISVMEGLKGQSNRVWRAWTPAQRATFARHGLRHWLHHRHRTPPPSFALIQRLLASGQLSIRHGRVTNLRPQEDGVLVAVGTDDVLADAVVNATGPSVDPADSRLLQDAVSKGLLAIDPLRLGFAVDAEGQAFGRDGQPVSGIWVLGSWTRGSHFEVIPLPVIRKRAAAIAEALVLPA